MSAGPDNNNKKKKIPPERKIEPRIFWSAGKCTKRYTTAGTNARLDSQELVDKAT